MLSKKEQAKAFVVVSIIFGLWHTTVEWTKLLMPFLQWDAHTTVFQIGVIYALGNLCTFSGTFLVGHLMDTSGAKFAGVVSVLLTFVYYLAASQAHSFASFLFIQPLRSAFCLNQVAEAYLASTTDENDRTKVLMRLGIPLGVAAVAGPWMASKTAVAFDIRGSVISAGIVLMVTCIPCLLFVLPEPTHLPHNKRPRMIRVSDYQELTNSRQLQLTLLIRFLLDGPYQAYDTLSRQYVISQFMSEYADLSYLFIVIGFTTIFANTFLIKLLQVRFKPQQLLQLALVILTAAYVLISFAKQFYQFLIFMPLQVIGMSLAYAELCSQTANSVERRNVGKAVALGHAVNLLAATLFSITAGYFISEFDFAIWCYIAAGVSIIVLVVITQIGSYMNSQVDKLPHQFSKYER